MSLRRRMRARREGAKASIDMNSLIDLTFLLLVVFIVTLPTLEQSIHVMLPVGKTSKAQDDKKKTFSITVNSTGQIYVGEVPTTREDLKASLTKAVADDPELSVLVRGDVRVGYGDVYEVVKIAKDCNVTRACVSRFESEGRANWTVFMWYVTHGLDLGIAMSENRCVCCGDLIPEGVQVCPKCEKTLGIAESIEGL